MDGGVYRGQKLRFTFNWNIEIWDTLGAVFVMNLHYLSQILTMYEDLEGV